MFYTAFSTNVYVQTALQVMRAGVAAIILDVVVDLAGKVIARKDILNIILMIAAFIASWFFGVSAIVIILLFIVLGIARTLKQEKHL
jgi:chromate transporter